MAKRWKKEELTYIKRYADKRRRGELAERFDTDKSTIDAKLEELGLRAKDSPPPRIDPMLAVYEDGLKAVQKGKWAEAAKSLERVVAETRQNDLAAGARAYLAVCAAQIGDGAKSKKDEDPFLVAVYERNRGNVEEALAICGRGGRQGKDERFAYLAAGILSATGQLDKSVKLLEQAIELNPKNRIHAFYDDDFDALRESEEHASILAE